MSISGINHFNFFCIPPAGKPAKDSDFSLGDNRPRVIQSKQKGPTCWFYVLIAAGRERYKGAPESLEERINEKAISSFRKELTKFDQEWTEIEIQTEIIQHLIHECKNGGAVGPLTKHKLQHIKPSDLKFVSDKKDLENTYNYHTPLLFDNYFSQTSIDNIEEYSNNLKNEHYYKLIESEERYLKINNITNSIHNELLDNYTSFLKADIYIKEHFLHSELADQDLFSKVENHMLQKNNLHLLKKEAYELIDKLPPFEKHCALKTIIEKDMYQKLGFTASSWDPCSSFDIFVAQIRKNGSHVVCGHFGQDYYKKPPTEQSKETSPLNKRIFYWEKNDPVFNLQHLGIKIFHAIVVIGVEKSADGDYIYYIDPNDETDPNHLSDQKLYKLPYEVFIKSVIPLTAFKLKKPQGQDIDINKIPSTLTGCHYAVYNTKKSILNPGI